MHMAGAPEGPSAEAVEKTDLSVDWPMTAATSCTSSGGWSGAGINTLVAGCELGPRSRSRGSQVLVKGRLRAGWYRSLRRRGALELATPPKRAVRLAVAGKHRSAEVMVRLRAGCRCGIKMA
ncbi:hypothetical protein HPB52_023299 [Rhipicephalus sanguineus]|uniref:Uncharacterized protein n=1 Tax=Rhipicephalus sanguineus TaxID=34632 RepID=A0A9D4YR25_RHISA|nr:hypothetical protein HPB52_023299 [Rhipicephalus sanguineus]